MHLKITGQHLDLTEALKNYVNEKIGGVDQYFDNVIDAEVVLRQEKFRNSIEVTLFAAGQTLHAEAEDKDMYAAIDAASDKLERQVVRYKEKLTNHHPHHNLDKTQVTEL
ncbi:ribosome hibernation-promoting factor, HPF/YfiA family [Thermithiobacillus plumbiphilus]|uniref:Ribosome hibernation promoting factor n=1 Tax=Thermithiobacillus plumbiphilus TaxID=1729899 RepID=A0ABU9D995_9PROT